MDFPMPDFGAEMEQIISYAIQWLDLVDRQNFLSVLAVFSLVLAVILWVIRTVKNPPSLDI
jgi:hypothetical protein